MLGQVLVEQGYAEVLTIAPNTRYAARFEAVEEGARKAGRGIWGACG
jgi:micrococcal nuclease